MSFKELRLNLSMSQSELSEATVSITGHRVWKQQIGRAENGIPISELTAARLLNTINELHKIRGRPALKFDDVIWTIRGREQTGQQP